MSSHFEGITIYYKLETSFLPHFIWAYITVLKKNAPRYRQEMKGTTYATICICFLSSYFEVFLSQDHAVFVFR